MQGCQAGTQRTCVLATLSRCGVAVPLDCLLQRWHTLLSSLFLLLLLLLPLLLPLPLLLLLLLSLPLLLLLLSLPLLFLLLTLLLLPLFLLLLLLLLLLLRLAFRLRCRVAAVRRSASQQHCELHDGAGVRAHVACVHAGGVGQQP